MVGAEYGRGFAICRAKKGIGWGSPGAVRLEGGSFGFQIGAESTDLAMLVMNKRSMTQLMNDKFTLGGSASVAAGPVGRSVSAKTDALLSAGILAWSRTHGAFAGISLSGPIRNDVDENQELYGLRLHNRDIPTKRMRSPASAQEFIRTLGKYSPKETT